MNKAELLQKLPLIVKEAVEKTSLRDIYDTWERNQVRADIVQGALRRCVEHCDKILGAASIPAYINAIAKNEVADHFRKRHPRPRSDLLEVDVNQPPQGETCSGSLSPSPAEIVSLLPQVDSVLDAYYPNDWKPRRVMQVYLAADCSITEAAKLLGRSDGYVRVNLSRFRDVAKLAKSIHEAEVSWETVNDVIRDHRQLIRALGFGATVEWMQATSSRLRQRALSSADSHLRRYVLFECAFAKILQMCGSHEHARLRLRNIEDFGNAQVLKDKVGINTFEAVNSIHFRLRQPRFGSQGCSRDLDIASRSMTISENQARPVWRLAIDAIARGSVNDVPSIVSRYLGIDITRGPLIPSGNVDLINSLLHTSLGRIDDGLSLAKAYLDKHLEVDRNERIPDPSIHGLLAGLVLDCNLRINAQKPGSDRDELMELAFDIEQFRESVGLKEKADGLLEIASVFDVILPDWRRWRRTSRPRKRREKKGNQRDFLDLFRRYREVAK